jgi:hypothetical protein
MSLVTFWRRLTLPLPMANSRGSLGVKGALSDPETTPSTLQDRKELFSVAVCVAAVAPPRASFSGLPPCGTLALLVRSVVG